MESFVAQAETKGSSYCNLEVSSGRSPDLVVLEMDHEMMGTIRMEVDAQSLHAWLSRYLPPHQPKAAPPISFAERLRRILPDYRALEERAKSDPYFPDVDLFEHVEGRAENPEDGVILLHRCENGFAFWARDPVGDPVVVGQETIDALLRHLCRLALPPVERSDDRASTDFAYNGQVVTAALDDDSIVVIGGGGEAPVLELDLKEALALAHALIQSVASRRDSNAEDTDLELERGVDRIYPDTLEETRAYVLERGLALETEIAVCAACNRACCWAGVFLCEDAYEVGIKDLPVSQLIDMRANGECAEHPDHWLKSARESGDLAESHYCHDCWQPHGECACPCSICRETTSACECDLCDSEGDE